MTMTISDTRKQWHGALITYDVWKHVLMILKIYSNCKDFTKTPLFSFIVFPYFLYESFQDNEVPLITKGLAIVVTCIGLLSSVSSRMSNETCPLAEALCTLTAFTGFLSCVSSLMTDDVGLPPESFPTLRTLVGLLPCVDFLMDSEGCLLAKGLPTLDTHRVSPQYESSGVD